MEWTTFTINAFNDKLIHEFIMVTYKVASLWLLMGNLKTWYKIVGHHTFTNYTTFNAWNLLIWNLRFKMKT
jgi:hypothetical protein